MTGKYGEIATYKRTGKRSRRMQLQQKRRQTVEGSSSTVLEMKL
jgi:hypothetical protein